MLSISVRAAIDIESPKAVVYGHNSVYDESSGNCIHAQW